MAHQWRGVIREYFDRLDVDNSTTIVTLGEGGTPLVTAPALAKLVGMQQHDLCRLEKGKTNPTFETQQKLLAQLGIEVEYRFTKRPESKISSATKSKRELQKTA